MTSYRCGDVILVESVDYLPRTLYWSNKELLEFWDDLWPFSMIVRWFLPE